MLPNLHARVTARVHEYVQYMCDTLAFGLLNVLLITCVYHQFALQAAGKSSPQLLNDAIASDFSFLAKADLHFRYKGRERLKMERERWRERKGERERE